MVRWPGKVPAGQTRTDILSVMDIMPTILDAGKIPIPDELVLDGQSMFSVFLGKYQANPKRSLCWAGPNCQYTWTGPNGVDKKKLASYKARAKKQCVSYFDILPAGWYARKGRWKLIDPGSGKLELYDLYRDPGEQNNIIASHPGIVEKLRNLFRTWIKEMEPPQECGIQDWQRLRKL